MAGLVPAIHVFISREIVKTWMPGIKPGMTMTRTSQTRLLPPCAGAFSRFRDLT
jgi:hypothetical protein